MQPRKPNQAEEAKKYYEQARKYEADGKIAEAKKQYEEAIKLNHTRAKSSLATLLVQEGTPAGNKRAFELFSQAAAEGHVRAKYNQAVMLQSGIGCEHLDEIDRLNKARKLFTEVITEKAKDNKKPMAERELGSLPPIEKIQQEADKVESEWYYKNGVKLEGAGKLQTAFTCYEKAALLGHMKGKTGQADLLFRGGEYEKAFKLFVQAGAEGHIRAKYNAALMLEKGMGCEKYSEATRLKFAGELLAEVIAARKIDNALKLPSVAELEGKLGKLQHAYELAKQQAPVRTPEKKDDSEIAKLESRLAKLESEEKRKLVKQLGNKVDQYVLKDLKRLLNTLESTGIHIDTTDQAKRQLIESTVNKIFARNVQAIVGDLADEWRENLKNNKEHKVVFTDTEFAGIKKNLVAKYANLEEIRARLPNEAKQERSPSPPRR